MARLGVARDAYVLQSKCGIVPGKMYDFSEEHILASVDGSLRRLRTDRLDFLLLHRPDALMRPEEVAAAFDKLAASARCSASAFPICTRTRSSCSKAACAGRSA